MCKCEHSKHEGRCKGLILNNDNGGLYHCKCHNRKAEIKARNAAYEAQGYTPLTPVQQKEVFNDGWKAAEEYFIKKES